MSYSDSEYDNEKKRWDFVIELRVIGEVAFDLFI